MIHAALILELRNLARSPLRLLILVLVLATGGFVIAQGQQEVERWQEAIATGQAAQEESLAEARGYFADGVWGPADRTWIDLRQPRWQDSYAATRVAREPAPLAGIAFASAESGAVTVRLSRFADPMLAEGNRIENPALAVAGGLDLVTVLALLLPLLILALGVEIGGFERAAGVLPLVRVQSGRDHGWIWARCQAVGVLAAVTGLILTGMAAVALGADLGSTAALAVLVLAYVAVWTALLGAVARVSRTPSQGAVALGAAWILLCVLAPSIGVERSAALAADDFALDLTVEARDAGNEAREMEEDELYGAVLARFPALEEHVPTPRSAGRRAAADGMRIVGMESRMQQRAERGEAHRRLVQLMSMLSPTVAFSHALEGLAGRSPAAAQAFQSAVADAVATRMERSIAATWSGEALTEADFEALVAASPASIEAPTFNWWGSVLTMAIWALALFAGGSLLARRLQR